MNPGELVKQVAAEAEANGWERPDIDIVGYYATARDALCVLYDLLLVAEAVHGSDRELRRLARSWAWAVAKALRDLGLPSHLELYEEGPKARHARAAERPEAVWSAVSVWDADALDREVGWLSWRLRFEAALVGRGGPTYKRATKLIGVTGVLIGRTCGPGRAPARARRVRERDGAERAAYASSDPSSSRSTEGDRERESRRGKVVVPRTRRGRATGSRARGGTGGEDGWDG